MGSLVAIFFSIIYLLLLSPSFAHDKNFLRCLSSHFPLQDVVFDHANTHSFSNLLQSSLQNLRFDSAEANKPRYIVTPKCASHVQAAVVCSKKHGLQVRTRSGGHDYEGFSYTSQYNAPFLIIDLVHLRSMTVDLETSTAWIEAGATLGELYYAVGNLSKVLGFPAGTCPSVGVGGHISGGGQGMLTRKYGLAADNVVDAVLVKANGDVVDREAMGEDLFWAIRGGGAASFGVILKWKVNLVPVTPKVTLCNIPKTLSEGATNLVHQWQQIAPKITSDLTMRVIVFPGNQSITALFNMLYLGTLDQLAPLVTSSFPELGFDAKFCEEMTWIESTVENRSDPIEVLRDRTHWNKSFFIGKSDYFTKPIPKTGLEEAWSLVQKDKDGVMIMEPYGGKMDKIKDSETPFPYRNGTLFNVQYYVKWSHGGGGATRAHLGWINKIYEAMGPYASKNPRGAYINYRDLSLGMYKNGKKMSSYREARVWGDRYFTEKNFKRLARVKAKVDPQNFFRNEQSIPPLFSMANRKLSG